MTADPPPTGVAPDALVLLVGPSGSGKSTWAARHFAPGSILESDAFRALVAGDAADQSATADAFKTLHTVARARLRRGLLTVVDATNLTEGARRSLSRLAAKAGRPVVAIAFDVPLERCLARDEARLGRRVPVHVVHRHHQQMAGVLARLPGEGYDAVWVLHEADLDTA